MEIEKAKPRAIVGRKATGPTGIAGLPNQKEFCGARGLYCGHGLLFLGPLPCTKEVIPILILKKCPFYRTYEILSKGRGLGCCDLNGEAICEGDVQFCENSNALRKQLLEQKNNEGEKDQEKKSSKYRVLVVDDQEQMRNLIVALLAEQGHQCITAGNGTEALDIINQSKFDAVITDIVIVQMDGIALTKELLSLYPHLPIMVITGYSKEYPTELAITAGARDFIGKPFSNDEFILRFNKMMGDQEILCQMEAKQIEMFVDLQSEA